MEYIFHKMKKIINQSKDTQSKEKWEREHFNLMAKNYEKKYGYTDTFTKYKINKKINKFTQFVSQYFHKEIKILEIGCGTGAYTRVYADKLPRASILAIDISEEMIRVARKSHGKRKNLRYEIKSAYRTGLKDSSVDVVCGFYILHHLNIVAVRKEVYRVLKPGGIAYFYEPNILNPIVFLIKSSQLLKRLIGDSSEEWAINPLKISNEWNKFKVIEIKTTEFVWPFSFIPFKIKLLLDKLTSSLFPTILGLKLIGGSIEICLRKI